jgi:hypothetical protein
VLVRIPVENFNLTISLVYKWEKVQHRGLKKGRLFTPEVAPHLHLQEPSKLLPQIVTFLRRRSTTLARAPASSAAAAMPTPLLRLSGTFGFALAARRANVTTSSKFSLPIRCYSAGSLRPRSSQQEPRVGTTTPAPANAQTKRPQSPFYFEAGYAVFAKRPSRPFPPPFLSPPSGSFSDALSTHDRSRDRRLIPAVNGEMIRGITNGDDAVLVSDHFIGANDGVGAWATKENGHAA